jgi:hypothetical protein
VDVPTTLTFLSWVREQVGGLVTATEHGRARVGTTVTLTGRGPDGAVTGSAAGDIRFLLAGPQDVIGLKPGAVVGRYPVPGAIDAETDKCTHVELADPALPWRYVPAGNPAASSGALHAWLVLVVGVDVEELTLTEDRVTLGVAVQAAHRLGAPASACPVAHVQESDGRRVARLLSRRPLAADTDYVAVLVPAYRVDSGGGVVRAWDATAPVTLPMYDTWRFRTAAQPGSFPTLAARLRPGDADPETGRAPMTYPYGVDEPLTVRGALAPLGSSDAPLETAVADDLAMRIVPAPDPRGRPVIGPPRYGEPWHDGATTWGTALNSDPRHRGVAGIGLELGIRLQDPLVDEARAHQGALAVAAQRLRHLSLGLAASGSLWGRRLPTDPLRQLWFLGPALRRVVTPDGPVADLATSAGRALPRGLFSSAARRVLRPGPARTALSAHGADPAAVLPAANRCPPAPPSSDDGVPPLEQLGVDDFDARRRRALGTGTLDPANARDAIDKLDLSRLPDRLRNLAAALVDRLSDAVDTGRVELPWGPAIEALTAAIGIDPRDDDAVEAARRRLDQVLEQFPEPAEDPADLLGLLEALGEDRIRELPCRPVDLEGMAKSVIPLFDPTSVDAPARVRVLSTIDGLDPAQPLTPPEVCVGLDRPVWRDLNGAFAEWLLPGVGELKDDTVIAVQTNPVFTDAFLVGYNTQLLAELRWRNIPVAARCTPLRVFWERADTGTGAKLDDIVDVAGWPDASPLGAASHRPGGAGGNDLVLVFRGQLFLRYPRTLLYLVSAVHGGAPDFARDPDSAAARVLPSFQGRIGADVTFFGFQGFEAAQVASHWAVLEEPPFGYRFFAKPLVGEPDGGPVPGDGQPVPADADGALYADRAFADPLRVLIRGDSV